MLSTMYPNYLEDFKVKRFKKKHIEVDVKSKDANKLIGALFGH